MTRAFRYAVIACALTLGALDTRAANSPSPLDQPPTNVLPAPVEIAPSAPAEPAARPAEPSGNPLWAVPLSALNATRDRPLFTPSRRAPAPVVAGPVAAAPPPPPPPSEPERPQLTLVGAIVGSSEGIAVFLDQTNNNVIRLRTGQDHLGWVLRSVKGREATLEKNQQSTTLELPAPGTTTVVGVPGLPIPQGMPGTPILPRPPLGPTGKPKEPDL
jgi:general secretion pathway protein N